MKIYLRLISFCRPVSRYAAIYGFFSLFAILFGVLNFSLLIPMLDVLFGTEKAAADVQALAAQAPPFELSLAWVKAQFDYFIAQEALQSGPIGALKVVCVVFACSIFLSNIFKFGAQSVIETLRANAVRNIRNTVFDKVSSLHLGFFSNERKGDIMSRLTTDIQEVETSLGNSFSAVLKEPFELIAYLVVLMNISVKLTLFTLVVIPVMGLFISFITRKMRRDAREGQQSLSRILSILDETIGGMRVVKAFNALDFVRQRFQAENGHYASIIRRMAIRREMAPPFSEFMGAIIVCCILLYGGSLVLSPNPEMSASQFITYVVIFSQVMRPAKSMANSFSSIQRGIAAGERIFHILDTPVEVTDQPQAQPLPTFSNSIRFENVGFAYGNTPVLFDINFELKKGQTVALVGPSGGGKSTLADLIPRFYDVAEGQITIDGRDIRSLQVDSLRAQMGIVTQESVLFNDTIFNNIAFGKPGATQAEVEEAARIANAHSFILESENGYQTVIGDRGMKLSGGQRQRLSIARAVLKNPPILILDEATSALDTESEKLVQEALTQLMRNRTSIVIAHRLSTIQHADKILVIQNGRIVEEGNHFSLLENPEGLYRRLQAMQAV